MGGQNQKNSTSPLCSGGLAWYICFQPLFFSTLWVSTLWGGVYPSPYPLPWTPDPLRVGTLELLIATFWPSCCPSFFHRFCDAIFDASWLDFPSQLASKNRCQDAKMPRCLPKLISFFTIVLFDFASQLGSPNPPKSMKNRCPDTIPC